MSALRYNTSKTNITLPTVPGLLFELACKVEGSASARLAWLVDGLDYNEKTFEMLNDEPFVINIGDKNASATTSILVMKLDTARPAAKYQCWLNRTQLVREHFIQVVGMCEFEQQQQHTRERRII